MDKKKEIFESMPVPKALLSLAVPTIMSQLITMIYNLADTFYIGQTGNPYMVAGVSLSFPLFFLITSLGNLFGIGGGSLISRMLGARRPEEAKRISSFSFWSGIASTFIFSIVIALFMKPLLNTLGASENTLGYSRDYVIWVIVVGAIPTSASMLLAHFLRSEGCAKQASLGIAGAGILNIILDPIFIFPLGLYVKGAAIATMLSNVASAIYFLIVIYKMRGRTVLSINPKNYRLPWEHISKILSVGFPAALATIFAVASNMLANRLASGYGDISLAAMGIVKKLDMLPTCIGSGIGQGLLPLVAYNYAAKNYARMKAFSRFAIIFAIGFTLVCIVGFEIFSPALVRVFIDNRETVELGAKFLRIACLAVPFMHMNALLNITFQAMGKGLQSLILSSCRQGLINIPLLLIMNSSFALFGVIWAQPISDCLTMAVSLLLYVGVLRQLNREEEEHLRSFERLKKAELIESEGACVGAVDSCD